MEIIDSIIDKIIGKWNKVITIIKLIILECIIYFTLGSYFLGSSFDKTNNINFLILSFIIIVTISIWYITTNRLPIKFNKKLKFALLISIDDEKYTDRIKRIINESISNIYSVTGEVEIILLPFNYLNNEKDIKKFINKRGFTIETLLWLNLSSGNFQNENITFEKIALDKSHFFSKLKLTENKRMYISDINMSSDIKLINFHKDWDYIEANSKADKKKYKINLSDLILQYISIYLIYIDKYQSALEILSKIQSNKEEKTVNKKKNIFKEGRFRTIIVELMFLLSRNYYFEKKNYQECHNLLTSTFKIVDDKHELAFERCSNLALTSYKIGDINLSKSYTEKLKSIKPNSPIINLNNAFYSILVNNPKDVSKYYGNLIIKSSSIKGINIIELIDFLCLEKEVYKNKPNSILFDFAEGFLSIHYGDKKLGIIVLEKFIAEYPNSELFTKELYDLAISSLIRKNKNKQYKRFKKAS
ncbi:hypothetical protein [Lutibacter sp.]